jgi:cytochrome c peroxidase
MAHSLAGVVARLTNDPRYVTAFERAYGAGPVTYEKVEKSIAAYERRSWPVIRRSTAGTSAEINMLLIRV